MIIDRGLVILALALGTAIGESPFGVAGAAPSASSARQHVAKAQGLAIAACEKTSVAFAGSNRRTLRRELQTFAEECAQHESEIEQSIVSGLTCDCGTNAITCQASTCKDGVCGTLEIIGRFSSTTTLESISTCIRYSKDPTGNKLDACMTVNYGPLGTSESCSYLLEGSSGAMATCTTCEVCNASGNSFNIDCSNIIADTTTGGCMSTDSMSGDGLFEFVNAGSGSGNGGLSTSSGAFHGSSVVLALGGIGLALIM
jgi:hypothetical protein